MTPDFELPPETASSVQVMDWLCMDLPRAALRVGIPGTDPRAKAAVSEGFVLLAAALEREGKQ